MEWTQVYDPLNNVWLSTALAALPIVLLLGLLGIANWPAPRAALTGLAAAILVATLAYGMPWSMALAAAMYGAGFGLFPIGWIVLNAIFLYTLTVEAGRFEIVKRSVAGLSEDRRIQAILIAFSFGAFIEGAAGFGTPVAISSALIVGAGFPPLLASGVALIANTAPVAFGALGYADQYVSPGHRAAGDATECHGGPAVALLFADRACLDGVDHVGLAGRARCLACVADQRRQFRAVAVHFGELCRANACRCRRRSDVTDPAGGLLAVLAAGGDLAVSSICACAVLATVRAGPRTDARAAVRSAWVPWAILSLCVLVWGLAGSARCTQWRSLCRQRQPTRRCTAATRLRGGRSPIGWRAFRS